MIKREIKSKLMFLIVLILKISLFLFVMSFLVMGIYAIYHGVEMSRVADESLLWPETGGVITDSYIHVYKQSDDDGHSSTWYRTVINYSYSVNGEGYSGNSITLLSTGPDTTDRGKVEMFITDYPKGLHVKVYYDPENPQKSILTKEKVGRINVFTAIGCFCIIVWGCGFIGLVAALRD